MEPNNFEKDFRENLNNRKIETSDKAWDRLDAMLSIAENKKPKKNFKWVYIAASIVGFLLIGTFYFDKEKRIENPKIEMVIQDNVQKDPVKKHDPIHVNPIEKQIVVLENKAISNTKDSDKERRISYQKTTKTIQNENNQVAESSIIIQKNQEKQSIQKQSIQNQTSPGETVDQLLTTVEKTVVADNASKPKSKVKINAADLLNEVDGELELSFREKVITKVNKNYQTVKVALANRNNQ